MKPVVYSSTSTKPHTRDSVVSWAWYSPTVRRPGMATAPATEIVTGNRLETTSAHVVAL